MEFNTQFPLNKQERLLWLIDMMEVGLATCHSLLQKLIIVATKIQRRILSLRLQSISFDILLNNYGYYDKL